MMGRCGWDRQLFLIGHEVSVRICLRGKDMEVGLEKEIMHIDNSREIS